MIYSKVIIIGGGPSGSICAWKLNEYGIECLILDKQEFPRPKLCAGWITPQVIQDLEFISGDYPFSFTKFDRFKIHIHRKEIELKVRQYAIRRIEFDDWLLKRSGVEVKTHEVKKIKKDGNYYVIDNQFCCRYLVGAGGTHCPVYRTFFKSAHPRSTDHLIVTLEEEFSYDYSDGNCHLWFLQKKLPGYAWYVPKNHGYLNIGIGAFHEKLKAKGDDIRHRWNLFTDRLEKLNLVNNHPFNAAGYVYYIRENEDSVHTDNAFIIGDAAGLATQDMGEGIGPAVKSGILAAESITSGKKLSFESIKKRSFPRPKILVRLLLSYLFK